MQNGSGKRGLLAACKHTSSKQSSVPRPFLPSAQESHFVSPEPTRSPAHSRQAALRQREPRAPQSGRGNKRDQKA